jgi:hypothetical protein
MLSATIRISLRGFEVDGVDVILVTGQIKQKKNLTTVKRSGHPAAAAARIRRWTFSFFNREIRLAGPSFFSPMLTTFQSLSSPPTLSFSLIK